MELVRADFVLLGDLFPRLMANYNNKQALIEEGASQEKIEAALLLEERLVSQLLITSQSIFTNTARVTEELHAETASLQRFINRLILILLVIIMITVTTTSYFVTRIIIRGLDNLKKGAEIIGKGNLNYRIEMENKNEFGELAVAFNQMTEKLNNSQKNLRRSYERLKELDKLKDEFLNIASHELKTPLIPIRSQTDLLLDEDYGKINKDQKEAVEMIARNELQMERLVSDVLDITKVKSKKLKLVTPVEEEKVFVVLASPSMVISKKSDDPGVDSIVPCTLSVPEKFLVYTAIMCNALLLFIPGLPSMLLEVLANGPPDAVKLVMDVLAVNSG